MLVWTFEYPGRSVHRISTNIDPRGPESTEQLVWEVQI